MLYCPQIKRKHKTNMNPDPYGQNQTPANQGYQPPVPPPLQPQQSTQPFGAQPQYPGAVPVQAPMPGYAPPQPQVQPPQPGPQSFQPNATPTVAGAPQPADNSFAYTGQPYVEPTKPPIQAAPVMPAASYTGQAPAYGGQPQAAAPVQTAPKKLKWFILIPIIVVMAAVMASAGWFVLNKFVLSGMSVAVPKDWKTLDTELGFTVKAPPKWDTSGTSSSELDKIKSKNVTLSPPIEFNFSSSDSGSTPSLDTMVAVTAASFEQTGQPDKATFEAAVTDTKTLEQVYSLFGGDSSKIKVEQTKVKIEGREWLKVDVGFEKASTTTLYHWVDDHAIGLSIAAAGETEKDSSVYQEYLLPMAASVELTE